MSSWSNKVVLITGASAGIGDSLARRLAADGARLALSARRADRLESLCSELSASGTEALAVECDVRDEHSVNAAITATIERFGQLDAVIANAGFGINDYFMRLSNDDYQRQFDTNVFGVMNTLRAAHPHLCKTRGRAAIIGSVNSHLSLPRASAYAMSKFAVRALAQSLWSEWRRDGISVTLICPGFVKSEIHRVNNAGEFNPDSKNGPPAALTMPAEKAADLIADAVLKRRKEKVITLHGKTAVWLSRHLPWLAHWIQSRLG